VQHSIKDEEKKSKNQLTTLLLKQNLPGEKQNRRKQKLKKTILV